MDKLIKKLGGYGSVKYREFMNTLDNAGTKLTTWYEAVQYKGEPQELTLELCMECGLFSKEHVAIGNDGETLRSLADYLKNHPLFKDRKFTFRQCRKADSKGETSKQLKTL